MVPILCLLWKVFLVINFGQKEASELRDIVLCCWKWSNNSTWTTILGILETGYLMTFQWNSNILSKWDQWVVKIDVNGWYTLRQYWKRMWCVCLKYEKLSLFKFLNIFYIKTLTYNFLKFDIKPDSYVDFILNYYDILHAFFQITTTLTKSNINLNVFKRCLNYRLSEFYIIALWVVLFLHVRHQLNFLPTK